MSDIGTSALGNNDRLYLNSDEAAKKLGVTRRTLEKWRMEGTGPKYIRVGGKRAGYMEQDLIDYLESNKIKPGDDTTKKS